MGVERADYGRYEVNCPHCKEEFEVSVYPTYCVLCGKQLEEEKKPERQT